MKNRAPNDIDVVTFFKYCKKQRNFIDKNKLNFKRMKKDFNVDGYLMSTENINSNDYRDRIVYWYSLWTHTRDGRWKDFVEVIFDYHLDKVASSILTKIIRGDLYK